MQQPFLSPSIVRLIASDELFTAGITQGKLFYLVYDMPIQRFHVVWWDRFHWLCSCDQRKCTHKLAVNDFVLEELQKHQIVGNDLTTPIEDGSNR